MGEFSNLHWLTIDRACYLHENDSHFMLSSVDTHQLCICITVLFQHYYVFLRSCKRHAQLCTQCGLAYSSDAREAKCLFVSVMAIDKTVTRTLSFLVSGNDFILCLS